MMPTVEEVERIKEKQGEHPEMPLGQAEQFMLSLSEIDCLLERLRLWMFMLDYGNMEHDASESLHELKNAMQEVEESQTFRQVMGVLLAIGNALNGTDVSRKNFLVLLRKEKLKRETYTENSILLHLVEKRKFLRNAKLLARGCFRCGTIFYKKYLES